MRGGTERVVSLADPASVDLGVPFDPGSPDGHTVTVLDELAHRASTGVLQVRQARSFPLAEAAHAQALSATGHAGGKITLAVMPPPGE